MLIKRLITLMFLLLIGTQTFPREGMWLPMYLDSLNAKEMQKMGLKADLDFIYNEEAPSLKDAIVLFGGGCTGSIISDQGLILTNHHCGYRYIQQRSTVDQDYLKNGFWATSMEEELPNPGLQASILVEMKEVTDEVLAGVSDDDDLISYRDVIIENIESIVSKAEEGNHYSAMIKPFYYGKKYYLVVYEIFDDIRLVGAPPSSIGKFGGDTDNWMWPRHTGDFSLFRIYADKNNKPAAYADDNVPYVPKTHVKISTKGVKPGDFTFVYGFPASTEQFLTSFAVDLILNKENPCRIDVRRTKLDIIESFMQQNDKLFLQYAAKHASISNGWKKWIGENRGLLRLNAIEKKRKLEQDVLAWAKNDKSVDAVKYQQLLQNFENTYDEFETVRMGLVGFWETIRGVEVFSFAMKFNRLIDKASDETVSDEEILELAEKLKSSTESFFKDYHKPVDVKMLPAMIEKYIQYVPEKYHIPLCENFKDSKFDKEKYVAKLFKKSILDDEQELTDFLADFKRKDYKKIKNDPIFELMNDFYRVYSEKVLPSYRNLSSEIYNMNRKWVSALFKMDPGKRYYPDANQTLRVSYGLVESYYPKDAVKYRYQTHLSGIMEKLMMDKPDYTATPKLIDLYEKKDFGQYGTQNEMPVCFIASNHTTGGNSGSPVFNAKGELIGLNFDRNWEGTMSDIMYDPDQCRNIMVDARYLLFLIDKFAGAQNLIDELTLAN